MDKLVLNCNNCKKEVKRAHFMNHFNKECLVSCPWGCPALISRDKALDHFNICDQVIVPCSNTGCNGSFIRKDVKQHDNVCEVKLVACKDCNTLFKRNEMKKHEMNCEEMVLGCINGCGEKFKRKVKNHYESCPEQNVSCLGGSLGCVVIQKRKLIKEHEGTCPLARLKPYITLLENKIKHLESFHNLSNWKFVQSSDNGSFTDKKFYHKGAESCIVGCQVIPSGVSEICFLLHKRSNDWSSFGIATSKSLKNKNFIPNTGFVGWTVGRIHLGGWKCGLVAGYTAHQENMFYSKIVGNTILPVIKEGDQVTLILDRFTQKLQFKHNGALQDVFVDMREFEKTDLHFAVAAIGEFECTIIS
uniref:TRAF-type domain-containing protein n=1 Tax=Arcella intermedia TaxID=1963864 RepID=A0A6B2L4S1_9EUKA